MTLDQLVFLAVTVLTVFYMIVKLSPFFIAYSYLSFSVFLALLLGWGAWSSVLYVVCGFFALLVSIVFGRLGGYVIFFSYIVLTLIAQELMTWMELGFSLLIAIVFNAIYFHLSIKFDEQGYKRWKEKLAAEKIPPNMHWMLEAPGQRSTHIRLLVVMSLACLISLLMPMYMSYALITALSCYLICQTMKDEEAYQNDQNVLFSRAKVGRHRLG